MENQVNCISENGSLSIKDLRDYISDNTRNKKLILKYNTSAAVLVNNDMANVVKIAEDNAVYVEGLTNCVIRSEELTCDGLDNICKIKASVCESYFKMKNIYELENIVSNKPIKKTNINISDFMKGFYKDVSKVLPVSKCKNVNFIDSIRKDSFCSVNVNLLTQILLNFLINAIKHSKSKDDRIDIVLNRLNRGNEVAISVIDYGVGVDIEKLYDSMRKGVSGGNIGIMRVFRGCGLYVCQMLAEKLDGRILVTNVKGGGAVFSLLLHYNNLISRNGFVAVSDIETLKNHQYMKMINLAMGQFYK